MSKVVEKKDGNKKKAGAPKSAGPTIASVANAAILDGKDNAEVLALVLVKFPDAKTGPASINWYRNKLREDNPGVKTSREITTARNAGAKAEKAKAKEAEKVAAKKAKAEAKAAAKAKEKSTAPAK